MVSVIWPLSSAPCPSASNSRGVLPLRRYIEETLRRSRTSYSTLQVALYYLVLIKSHVPCHDFTMEQSADSVAMRSMQCGRRMFLAALILASKYLQDRNYSAKAWSKMSGLKTTEINSNERLFLSAVNWKLHITDSVFKRWTDIVLRFTAPPFPPSPTVSASALDSKATWARVIPLLTPELDDPRILALSMDLRSSTPAQGFATPPPTSTPTLCSFPSIAVSKENTPVPSATPRSFESRSEVFPPTPGLTRMGPLPTPQMTPSSIASSTPAVSACSSRRPSISMAMAHAQNNLLCRITNDRLAGATAPQRSSSIRYPSVASSTLSWSSPESMISDFTRSSRSSSISSVSTASTGAPHRIFVRPATCRSNPGVDVIDLETSPSKRSSQGTADHPITILDDGDFTSSPEVSAQTIAPLNAGESRKRCRSRPSSAVDSELQEQVRALLHDHPDAMEIDSDGHTAEHCVSPCALTKAMANLTRNCPMVNAIKGLQPPSNLRRDSSASRLPISTTDGRKRICSSMSTSQLPDVFMEVKPSVWQGIA